MSRHGIRGDGSRWGSVPTGAASGRISPPQNLSRRGFSHAPPKPHQPPRKADILMEAGRLAAEYLVSKGLLPPDSLPGKRHIGAPQPPPMPESRSSAIPRIGNAAPDVGHGRRRFNDEHDDRPWPRKFSGGKRKVGPCDRRHDSDWGDWGRKWRGTHGPRMDRARGYSDHGGEDDFAPRFHRDWRGGFREAGIRRSRVPSDELPSRSEATGESGSEQNHGSSSRTRKDRPSETNVDFDKRVDDSWILNSEAGDQVKSKVSGDLVKRTAPREIRVMKPGGVEDGPVSQHDKDLLKLCMFAKVPTKPRSSSLANTNPKVDGGAASNTSKVVKSSSSDLPENQTNNLKCQVLDHSSVPSAQSITVNPRHESCQSPQGVETSRVMVDRREEDSFAHVDKREGIKRENKPSSSKVSQENEHSCPYVERVAQDEGMIEAVDPVCESGFVGNMEKEKRLESVSFKICDLNLMGSPEITEILDDHPLDHQPTSLALETKKKLLVDFDLSTRNNANNGDDRNQLSGDDKVVPVIDLEDDSPKPDNISGCSKLKSEDKCVSLENILSHTPDTADITGTQDGYSLEISELLGSNISRCPSVQADLNNLPTGMSLHSTEGFPGDDDPIYVSLGELPISFMEVWDQPPQDYEKFF